MQANIAMKFAEYMAEYISTVNFGEKKFTTVPEILNFSYGVTFWCAVYSVSQKNPPAVF